MNDTRMCVSYIGSGILQVENSIFSNQTCKFSAIGEVKLHDSVEFLQEILCE